MLGLKEKHYLFMISNAEGKRKIAFDDSRSRMLPDSKALPQQSQTGGMKAELFELACQLEIADITKPQQFIECLKNLHQNLLQAKHLSVLSKQMLRETFNNLLTNLGRSDTFLTDLPPDKAQNSVIILNLLTDILSNLNRLFELDLSQFLEVVSLNYLLLFVNYCQSEFALKKLLPAMFQKDTGKDQKSPTTIELMLDSILIICKIEYEKRDSAHHQEKTALPGHLFECLLIQKDSFLTPTQFHKIESILELVIKFGTKLEFESLLYLVGFVHFQQLLTEHKFNLNYRQIVMSYLNSSVALVDKTIVVCTWLALSQSQNIQVFNDFNETKFKCVVSALMLVGQASEDFEFLTQIAVDCFEKILFSDTSNTLFSIFLSMLIKPFETSKNSISPEYACHLLDLLAVLKELLATFYEAGFEGALCLRAVEVLENLQYSRAERVYLKAHSILNFINSLA